MSSNESVLVYRPRRGRIPEPVRLALCEWLTANRIDPDDVPTDEPIHIETRDGQPVIVYTVFLRNESGNRYLDPQDPGMAAREQRTVPCLVEPPKGRIDTTKQQP